MISTWNITLSLLGGIIPALVWLIFWLKEDSKRPEPKTRILLSFFCGMIAVWPAIEIERLLCGLIDSGVCHSGMTPSFVLIIVWATIEELFKLVATFFGSFWKNKHYNEPIDATIYIITTALGFSALENAMFIFNMLNVGLIPHSIITGNSRFIGATLLHVASSASIGIMLGLSFYKNIKTRLIYFLSGTIIAIVLHTVFNLLIIKFDTNIFFVFALVWIMIVILLAMIQRIKSVRIKNEITIK